MRQYSPDPKSPKRTALRAVPSGPAWKVITVPDGFLQIAYMWDRERGVSKLYVGGVLVFTAGAQLETRSRPGQLWVRVVPDAASRG
jgi:hypothetical protein